MDESLILEIYARGKFSRITTVGMMADAMKYIDDPDVLETMKSTIRKVELMSDAEYKYLETISANDFIIPEEL